MLASALPPVAWREAADVDRWFLHDVAALDGSVPASAALHRLARATREGLGARLVLDDEPERVVRPLGLVLAAGRWLLVHDSLDESGPDVCPLDGLREVALMGPVVGRPATFELAEFWSSYRAERA